jgi:archaellum component FlaC
MEVKLDKDYYLMTDKYSFILGTKVKAGENTKKAGEIQDKYLKFYSTIEGFFQGYKKQKLIESDAKSIEDLKKEVKNLNSTVSKISKQIAA